MNQNNLTSTIPMLFSILPNLPTITREALAKSNWPQSMAYAWLEKHPEITSMQDWMKEQLFALSTFYFPLQGHRWQPKVSAMNVKDWLSYSVSECKWGGPLNYFQTSISDLLPRELASLTKLTSFSISGGGILNRHVTGTIPSTLGLLSNLNYLYLKDNRINGSIPSEIGLLSKLTSLDLGYNDIGGSIPCTIGLMSDLRRLDLSINLLRGTLPTEIGLLTKLTELNIMQPHDAVVQSKVAGIEGYIPSKLGSLANVNKLILTNNALKGMIPSELGRLTKLALLRLNTNDITGTIPSELCSLSIKYLWVDCDLVVCRDDCQCKCEKIL